MFILLEIQGLQYKVSEGEFLYVNYLGNYKAGKILFFKNIVLFYQDENNTFFGEPFLENIKVSYKILQHVKNDKVIVFKKKRRKGYKVKNGHRQLLTKIQILSILK